MAKPFKGLLEAGKMSVAAHFCGLCCPFCVHHFKWGNKRRGRLYRYKHTLRDVRNGRKWPEYRGF